VTWTTEPSRSSRKVRAAPWERPFAWQASASSDTVVCPTVRNDLLEEIKVRDVARETVIGKLRFVHGLIHRNET
jgi:hypothetical protein